MNRRSFLKSGGALAVAAAGARVEAGERISAGRDLGHYDFGSGPVVPAHNWENYHFGSGPAVTDRLDQGPFPQYPPDATIPSDDVVMTTTPSLEPVPGYGKGLITYITADMGTAEIQSSNIPRAIEELVQFPLGDKLYIRPTWREIQPRRGRLDFPEYIKLVLELARKSGKRVAFRVQMSAPDYYHAPALPEFVLDRVPLVKLTGGTWPSAKREHNPNALYQPRFQDPNFQQAFQELVGLLAAEFNGSPVIEFMDTFMYGFWGEGHTWPFTNNPFPDYYTAEWTWMHMLEVQLEHFTRTPLATNTQPDYSRVGNSELLDRTVRSNNWMRSDTIFIENQQIEELSNRPPWTSVTIEAALPGRSPQSVSLEDGISPSDNTIAHVMDVGANYWSLWNFHDISAANLKSWYEAFPAWFDEINRRIGYRVRPSFLWSYEDQGYLGIIIGFANDGIAGVPGVLRVTVESQEGKVLQSGCLDAGYPHPGKIRQAQFVLPKGTKFDGLRLRAEIEVKGVRYPVQWTCHQKRNEDGTLTLRANRRHDG
jgi:hypothetical protein